MTTRQRLGFDPKALDRSAHGQDSVHDENSLARAVATQKERLAAQEAEQAKARRLMQQQDWAAHDQLIKDSAATWGYEPPPELSPMERMQYAQAAFANRNGPAATASDAQMQSKTVFQEQMPAAARSNFQANMATIHGHFETQAKLKAGSAVPQQPAALTVPQQPATLTAPQATYTGPQATYAGPPPPPPPPPPPNFMQQPATLPVQAPLSVAPMPQQQPVNSQVAVSPPALLMQPGAATMQQPAILSAPIQVTPSVANTAVAPATQTLPQTEMHDLVNLVGDTIIKMRKQFKTAHNALKAEMKAIQQQHEADMQMLRDELENTKTEVRNANATLIVCQQHNENLKSRMEFVQNAACLYMASLAAAATAPTAPVQEAGISAEAGADPQQDTAIVQTDISTETSISAEAGADPQQTSISAEAGADPQQDTAIVQTDISTETCIGSAVAETLAAAAATPPAEATQPAAEMPAATGIILSAAEILKAKFRYAGGVSDDSDDDL